MVPRNLQMFICDQLYDHLAGKDSSPMQKSEAETSIAIFIFSLYPVLPIASLTRSKASSKLQKFNKSKILNSRAHWNKIVRVQALLNKLFQILPQDLWSILPFKSLFSRFFFPRDNVKTKACLEIFGAKPPSSPTLHPHGPYFSVITACSVRQAEELPSTNESKTNDIIETIVLI